MSAWLHRFRDSPALLATVSAIPAALLAGTLAFWLLPHGQSDAPEPREPDTGPVSVVPLTMSAETATSCRALLATLPSNLLGNAREVRAAEGSPAHPPLAEYAAAWDDPAIVLRCGVGRPAALTPSAQLIGVNGVEWVPDTTGPAVIWTTTSLPVAVEVTVPEGQRKQAATEVLNPLAAPVLAALAENP